MDKKYQQIPYTKAYSSHIMCNEQCVVLDTTNYPTSSLIMTHKAHVRDLARLLRHIEPMTFGLLRCQGAIEVLNTGNTQFKFILDIYTT